MVVKVGAREAEEKVVAAKETDVMEVAAWEAAVRVSAAEVEAEAVATWAMVVAASASPVVYAGTR